jgi:hypothetical protein
MRVRLVVRVAGRDILSSAKPGAALAAMIGRRATLAVCFVAIVFSLHSLKFCLNCKLLPERERTIAKCTEYDEDIEPKVSLVSAGFVSPSTLHTVEIEDANGDVNCWAACTLGLRHNYSETVVCTSAKPTVVFQDLAEGEYTITANCDESRISCYAEPQEYTFHVQQQTPRAGALLTEIPVINIKLYKKYTGRCSNEKIWKSRITCFALLETLMGVVFLLISMRERYDGEITPRSKHEDIKWLLQAKSRS